MAAGSLQPQPRMMLQKQRTHCAKTLMGLALVLSLSEVPGRSGDAFIQIGSIPGEATAAGHAGWTQVYSWSQGISRPAPLAKPAHSEISLTKPLDKGTPYLYDHVDRGTVVPKATIEFLTVSSDFIRFYTVTLTDVIVSSVSTSASEAGIPSESISLNYVKISWNYTQVNLKGGSTSGLNSTWDLAAAKGTFSGNAVTDTDGDGMSDAYELAYGLNRNVDDSRGDLDGDGLKNYEEYLAGTAPNSGDSVFKATSVDTSTGNFRISWNSVGGKSYEIHGADQVEGPYTLLRTVQSSGDGETFSDFPASANRQFYRIVVP